jgi:hypothetical protein
VALAWGRNSLSVRKSDLMIEQGEKGPARPFPLNHFSPSFFKSIPSSPPGGTCGVFIQIQLVKVDWS